MPGQRMTDLTKTRQAVLDGISERFDSQLTLLLFIDGVESGLNLLCSYASVRDKAVLELLRNRLHHIDCAGENDISEDRLRSEAAAFVHDLGLDDRFPGTEFSYHVLTTDCSPFDYACDSGTPRNIGILVTAACRPGATLDPADLDLLASDISIGRSHRFISTVLCTQNDLAEPGRSLDDAVRAASEVFARELGAGAFLYRNKNKDSDWTEYPQRKRRGADDSSAPPSQRLNMTSESDHPELEIARRPHNGETLEVTLSQRSHKIANLPFGRADQLTESLPDARSQAIGISFRYKEDPGYLQSRFSEMDQRIAEAVYANLQNFAESKLADESYEEVFSILHGKSLTLDGAAKDLLSVLQRLSTLIDNVHILSIGLLEDETEVRCESAVAKRPINKAYIARLKSKYLDSFYYGGSRPDYNQLAMGMDANDKHFYVEAHTPREFSDSRVYVISFAESFVAQATLNALINLFTELFTRMKEEDFRTARSNVLTETRHAVFHHFAASKNWISAIKTDWDMALRHKEHWARMLEEALFTDGLDWANWSLHQAQLILENGRFLVKEIDPKTIARKPMNVLQIMQDCYRALRVEARRKSVLVHIIEKGSAPINPNGDEVLMKIAVMNLMDNAIKYSMSGGTARCELSYKQDRYEVKISNRGDPIPERQFRHLLQIGFRGRQRDHLNLRPGTGLGLPVADRILRAHSPLASLQHKPLEHSVELGGAGNMFFFEMPYLTGLSNVASSSDDRRG